MDRKMFRSLMFLITYTILLGMVLINHAAVFAFLRNIVVTCRPLLIGLAIAFVLNRPCGFFQRLFERILPGRGRRSARPLAVLVSYIVLLGAVSLLISFVIPNLERSITTFAGSLNTYVANLQGVVDWLENTMSMEILEGVDLSGLSSSLRNLLNSALNALTTAVPQLINATAKLVSGVITLFLSVVFSVYLLADGPRLLNRCRRVITTYLPGNVAAGVLRVARITADTFTNFVTGQATEALILGSLCFVGMTILRFDYAPLISVIITVSALIPVAGAYLGGGVSCLLLVMIDPMQALWFLVFLVILQQLEGNIIYPRVVGTSIGLPGLWVLAAVTVGGGLFGFVGMLIGVPVAAVLYTLLRDDVARRDALRKNAAEDGE